MFRADYGTQPNPGSTRAFGKHAWLQPAVVVTHSFDAIISALHETISGPAGEARDWDRFGSLFFPGARLIRTSIAPDRIPQASATNLRAYPEDTTGYFRLHSFHEVEIARRIESFGNVAHVLSTNEARHEPAAVKPFKRGINSIQLFNDGRRWWVISVPRDNEREDCPIPAEYLP